MFVLTTNLRHCSVPDDVSEIELAGCLLATLMSWGIMSTQDTSLVTLKKSTLKLLPRVTTDTKPMMVAANG